VIPKRERRNNMGHFTDDMTRLCGEIGALRSTGEAFIHALRHDTAEMKENAADMLSGFRRDHTEMAKKMKDGLGLFVSGLKADVFGMQAGFREDRIEMITKTKEDHQDFLSQTEEFVAGLREEVADMLSIFRNDRAEMAGEMKEDLEDSVNRIKDFVSALMDDVAEMRRTMSEEQAEMARKSKEDLEGCIRDLKDRVAQIRSTFQNEYKEMSRKGKAERGQFLSDLKESLLHLMEGVTDFRMTFLADLEGAREAWRGAGAIEKKVKATSVTKKGETKEPPEEVTPDDLMAIQGIGPAMQNRLNQAGVYTFNQLANSNPDELCRHLGKSSRKAAVEKWIAQAKERVIEE
jgi:predicted flap endonuclease-1-like 5' DNA nuclease/gas vesicle protein